MEFAKLRVGMFYWTINVPLSYWGTAIEDNTEEWHQLFDYVKGVIS